MAASVAVVVGTPVPADATVPGVVVGFDTPVERPLANVPSAHFSGVSCADALDCTAVGWYGIHPFFARELNGVWGPSTTLPNNLGSTGGGFISAVSCWTAMDCIAVGRFARSQSDSVANQPGYILETNGVWGPNAIVDGSPGGGGEFQSVSCASAGNCTAVGMDYDFNSLPMHADEVEGVWGTPHSVLLGFGGIHGGFYAVSCAAAGECTGVGWGSNFKPFSAEETGGVWGGAQTIMENPGNYPYFYGISCTAPQVCTAVGSSHDVDLAITQTNGVWGTPTQIPTAIGGPLNSVTCMDAQNCTAVGGRGYAIETDGVWGVPAAVEGAPGGFASFTGLSCTQEPACTAVGGDGNFQPVYATSVVAQPKSTATVNVNTEPPPGGDPQTVWLDVTVTGAAGTPTGTVHWTVDPAEFTCADSALVAGLGVCHAQNVPPGGYTVTAHYSGDDTYAPADGTVGVVVNGQSTTTVTVTGEVRTVRHSVAIIFTAAVTGPSGTPTGAVEWTVEGPSPVSCKDSPLRAGTATCTALGVTPGGYTARARYFGDNTYAPAEGDGQAIVTCDEEHTAVMHETAGFPVPLATELFGVEIAIPWCRVGDAVTVRTDQISPQTTVQSDGLLAGLLGLIGGDFTHDAQGSGVTPIDARSFQYDAGAFDVNEHLGALLGASLVRAALAKVAAKFAPDVLKELAKALKGDPDALAKFVSARWHLLVHEFIKAIHEISDYLPAPVQVAIDKLLGSPLEHALKGLETAFKNALLGLLAVLHNPTLEEVTVAITNALTTLDNATTVSHVLWAPHYVIRFSGNGEKVTVTTKHHLDPAIITALTVTGT